MGSFKLVSLYKCRRSASSSRCCGQASFHSFMASLGEIANGPRAIMALEWTDSGCQRRLYMFMLMSGLTHRLTTCKRAFEYVKRKCAI